MSLPRLSLVVAGSSLLLSCGGGAGAAPDAGAPCNTLVNDAPPINPKCPSGTGPACVTCPTLGTGGPILDGTYDLYEAVVYESACGALQPVWAVLDIAAPTMQSVHTGGTLQASDANAQAISRDSSTFTQQGTEVTINQTCGASVGTATFQFGTSGDFLTFDGITSYKRRSP